MNPIRIIFLDLDGTLLTKDHKTVTDRTVRALNMAHDAGVLLAVATGRCRLLIPDSVLSLPFDYHITANGADVYRTADGYHPLRMLMRAEDALAAHEILKPFGFFLEWYVDGGIAVDASISEKLLEYDMPEWHRAFFAARRMTLLSDTEAYLRSGAQGLEKINVVRCNDMEKWAEAVAALERAGRFELSSALSHNIEINPLGCTKGQMIRRLCAHLGIPLASTAALGDGNNDIEMLKTVAYGVAMGNAKPSVKAVVQFVTETNEQDGVSMTLEGWLEAGICMPHAGKVSGASTVWAEG